MFNSRSFVIFLTLLVCSFSALAQRIETYPIDSEIASLRAEQPSVAAEPPVLPGEAPSRNQIRDTQVRQLFSPLVSQVFYEIGYELANSKDITPAEVEQAIVLLTAATKLDNSASDIQPLLIKLMCQATKQDYSENVYYALEDYVDKSADLEVVRYAIQYLLEQLNSREEREVLLKAMLRNFGDKNLVLRSELATFIGVLMAEKPDLEAAQFYLVRAYSDNKYNKIAFEKLVEIMPGQIGPAVYLEQLRLTLLENPADIDTGLAFAQYAERLELYDLAGNIYEYCADLFHYLFPPEPLPARIYLPMAICYYNTQQNQNKCLEIAAELRRAGRFDLLLESIAGKAAMKIGDTEQANRIFQAAEEKAQQLLEQGPQIGTKPQWTLDDRTSLRVNATQFAWFYCFVLPDKQKSLDWANKAYSTEPNSPSTAALLAYSLLLNQQTEWAKPLINNYQRNQIADLTLAQIQINESQRGLAINTLRSVVARDPGSIVAEYAKELLLQLDAAYTPPLNPDTILAELKSSLGPMIVPEFIKPEEILSVQLITRGNEFSYGSTINGTVAIKNNSAEPLVISEDSLFTGDIRIDAVVSGDLEEKIPNLVSRRFGTTPLIEPGRSMLIPVQLVSGRLRQLLLAHPQASLDIEFTIYIDPIINPSRPEGEVTNKLTYIQPTKVLIKRPGIALTGKYLRNRFNSISTGQTGQKIMIAQLFVGLLTEQQAMAGRQPLYRYLYADWMPTMLKSALINESGLLRNSGDSEWIVKVHTMANMLSLQMDQEMTRAVADNMNNAEWPVRMMALYLLAKDADGKFDRVLQWAAKNDPDKLVRDMAVALGGTVPKAIETTSQPKQNSLKQ